MPAVYYILKVMFICCHITIISVISVQKKLSMSCQILRSGNCKGSDTLVLKSIGCTGLKARNLKISLLLLKRLCDSLLSSNTIGFNGNWLYIIYIIKFLKGDLILHMLQNKLPIFFGQFVYKYDKHVAKQMKLLKNCQIKHINNHSFH